jgi:hypothetical protein
MTRQSRRNARHVTNLRSSAIVLALAACTPPSADDLDDAADGSSESGGESESTEEPGLPLGTAPSPQAVVDPFPVSFPGRAEDLAPGEVWRMTQKHSGEGCTGGGCPIDVHGVRWDSGTDAWSRYKAGTSGPESDEHVVFGKPVYALTDGQVIGCWRGYPDHPLGNEDPTECACNVETIVSDCTVDANASAVDDWEPCNEVMRSGGNAIVVLMDDGFAVGYNHLKRDSIPEELCPDKPALAFPTDPSTPATGGDLPEEYLTCPPGAMGTQCDENDRPRVEKGDRIGNAGHNGNSSGPHLHFAVSERVPAGNDNFEEVEGSYREMMFHEAWYQEYTAGVPEGDWLELDGDALNAIIDDVGSFILWPDPVRERSDDATGPVINEAATATYADFGVTAYRDAGGNMDLQSWRVSFDGQIDLQDTDSDNVVSSMMAIARIGNSRDVVTARRRGSNSDLMVTTWDVVNATGVITKDSEVILGDVNAVAIAPAPSDIGVGAITAVRNGSGNLQVDTWSINAATLALAREETDIEGAISQVAVVGIQDAKLAGEAGEFQGAVTASIASGNLELRTWEIDAAWNVTSTDVDTKGTVSDVALTTVSLGSRQAVVAAVRNVNGNLQLILWEIDEDGTLVEGDSDGAGSIKQVSISSGSQRDLLVGARGSSDDFELITWNIDADGGLRRGGTIGGSGTLIDMDIDPDTVFLGTLAMSTIRTNTNGLKWIAWPTNLESTL